MTAVAWGAQQTAGDAVGMGPVGDHRVGAGAVTPEVTRHADLVEHRSEHRSVDLFSAMNVATAGVLTEVHNDHTGADVLRFFKHIDASVPPGLGVHVVLDDLSAHATPKDCEVAGAQ